MFADRARMGASVRKIAIIDDSTFAPSSGTGTDTHTYTSKTSTGPDTIVFLTWTGQFSTLSGVTYGGVSMTQLVIGGSASNACAIYYISGAQTGNVVVTFTGSISDSQITIASLTNLQSATAVDTDVDSVSPCDMDALDTPGVGGIRLVCFASTVDATGCTWVNATELSDVDIGVDRHSTAYTLGDDGSTISLSAGGGGTDVMVGVSLR